MGRGGMAVMCPRCLKTSILAFFSVFFFFFRGVCGGWGAVPALKPSAAGVQHVWCVGVQSLWCQNHAAPASPARQKASILFFFFLFSL